MNVACVVSWNQAGVVTLGGGSESKVPAGHTFPESFLGVTGEVGPNGGGKKFLVEAAVVQGSFASLVGGKAGVVLGVVVSQGSDGVREACGGVVEGESEGAVVPVVPLP